MPTFEEQQSHYMYSDCSPTIRTYTDCRVTPLMFTASGGKAYFEELRDEINKPDVEFIYIAGWWLDRDFSLDGPTGGTRLVDLLKAKSAAGVDVRVLGWVMPPEILRHPAVQATARQDQLMQLNGDTMRFIEELRTATGMRDKACLNILSHPAGAVHTKMSIVGNGKQAVGFTGGIDLESRRHQPWWHDVAARITGPVVQSLYDFYSEMWAEIASRPPAVGLTSMARGGTKVSLDSHSTSMPAIPARTLSSPGGNMVAQDVCTLPQFNIAATSSGVTLPRNSPLSYAPTGRTDVKAVSEKAVRAARRYVYIEDQALISAEVFSWINDAVKRNEGLQVVLLIGGNDPATPSPRIMTRMMAAAINGGLLGGLTQAQVNNIGLFRYRAAGGGSSVSHTAGAITKFVHTKSTIVDDRWAIIGSANCMRRSLYTDIENSVAFMDRDGMAVPAYRSMLWAEHLQATFTDADAALARWFSVPFVGSGSANPLDIDRIPLWPIASVLKPAALDSDDQLSADELLDIDSTKVWGGRLVGAAMHLGGTTLLSP